MNIKNSRRMHRAWSMILCCVLLLGLLPTTTLAVERDAMDQAIETVSIRINPPSPGSSLSYQATPGDSNYYTVNSVKWYDHTAGSYVQSGTLAVDGHEYVVEITVSTVSDNYCFRQGYVRGVVNDNYGTAETTYAYDSEVVVKYRFAVKTEPVHNIYVDDIDVPRPGCTPDYEPDMDAANHTVSGTNEGNFTDGVYWYDLTNSKTLKPTDTFKEGNKYRIFVDVVPRSGYYFIVNAQGTILTKAYVNREAANVMQYLKEDTQKRLNVYYDFVCEYDEISSVGITGLDAPAEGKTPDYSVKLAGTEYTLKTTSASNPYVVSGVNWYDETAGSDLTATAKFIGGHTYTATVYLVPDTGCRFTGSVSGKINGNTATVSGNGSEIQVKYTFPALATNQITTVAIEGITAPATGAAPSYVAIVKGEGYSLKARNDAYYKNGICWSIMESSDLPVSGGTTFEGGQKYQITMYLVAEEGYEFSATAGGALNVKATACYFMDCRAFYRSYLRFLRKEQLRHSGAVPTYIPSMGDFQSCAIWSDAAVLIPDTLLRMTGSMDEVAEYYPMMRDWVDWVAAHTPNYLYDTGFQLGDWLAQDGITPQSFKGATDDVFLATAYYWNSAVLTSQMADLLGQETDAAKYNTLANKIRQTLLDTYFTATGRLSVDTQAAYIVALKFGLYRDRRIIVEQLMRRLKYDRFQIKCGFAGAPLLCQTMAEQGLTRLACDFLLNRGFPGWLYCVELGATTIWERWNSLLADGACSGTGMNSFNHYAYGSVVEFIFSWLAGIRPAGLGFRRAAIAPYPDIRIGQLDCRCRTTSGLYGCSWRIDPDGMLRVIIEVPFGCTARIILPESGQESFEVGAGRYEYAYQPVRDFRLRYDMDTRLSELSNDEAACFILAEEAPQLLAMLQEDNAEFATQTFRELSHAFFMGLRPQQVEQMVSRLSTLICHPGAD